MLTCVRVMVVVALMLSLADVVAVSNAAVADVDYRNQALSLTPQQMSEIVDYHNAQRAEVGAANMQLVTYDEALATEAAKWAAKCEMNPQSNPDYMQYIYITDEYNFTDTKRAVNFLFRGKDDYISDTMECAAGKNCEIYPVLVTAGITRVGCASQLCESVVFQEKTYPQLLLMACNYFPKVSNAGVKPYVKGPACTKCGSGAGWCKDGLCNGGCEGPGTDCSCAALCYNCATLDLDTCRCSCADGWHDTDCSVRCEDADERCNAAWTADMCQTNYTVKKACPVMCGLCTPDPDAVPNKCSPVSYNTMMKENEVKKSGPESNVSPPRTFVTNQQATMIFVIATVALSIINNASL